MKIPSRWSWAVGVIVIAFLFSASLSDEPITAAARDTVVSMANAAAQREEMIRELQEIKSLIREQNELLRGGKVAQPPKQ